MPNLIHYADAALGERPGAGFAQDQVVAAIDRLLRAYLDLRQPGESFVAAVRRVGLGPFKTALYGQEGRHAA